MIDPDALVQDWLKNTGAISALVGTNVFIPAIPEGFSCATGAAAIVIRRRGGTRHQEITPLLNPSFAIEAWAQDSLTARQIFGVVSDTIHGANAIDRGSLGYVIWAQEEVSGQDVTDPDTHSATCFGYFRILMRAQVS